MTDNIKQLLKEMEQQMQQTLQHLEKEFSRIRAGKASPDIFEDIKIEYYGTLTPLNQVASINIPDARTIVIQPWDKSVLGTIEKAILSANLGFTPINNGEILRINMPPITEERRKELVKKAKQEAENARVAIRNIRRTYLERAKNLKKKASLKISLSKLKKTFRILLTTGLIKSTGQLRQRKKIF